MAKPAWNKFPHADAAYAYEGPALKQAWTRLHAGDREPFPKEPALQEAWRRYHAGDFQAAMEQGRTLGGSGLNPEIKAQSIYATYLEKTDAKKQMRKPSSFGEWPRKRFPSMGSRSRSERSSSIADMGIGLGFRVKGSE